jgi:hypothetical protein
MSDLVALSQEIAKWQKSLEEHEANMLQHQNTMVNCQRQKYECERVLFDLKDRLCALCKEGHRSKSPEPPLKQHMIVLDANGARQFDREKTIAYDAVNVMPEAGVLAGPSQASQTHAAEKSAAGGSKNARCPFVAGKSFLPCAFKAQRPGFHGVRRVLPRADSLERLRSRRRARRQERFVAVCAAPPQPLAARVRVRHRVAQAPAAAPGVGVATSGRNSTTPSVSQSLFLVETINKNPRVKMSLWTMGPESVGGLPILPVPPFIFSLTTEKHTKRSPGHVYISATCVIHIIF